MPYSSRTPPASSESVARLSFALSLALLWGCAAVAPAMLTAGALAPDPREEAAKQMQADMEQRRLQADAEQRRQQEQEARRPSPPTLNAPTTAHTVEAATQCLEQERARDQAKQTAESAWSTRVYNEQAIWEKRWADASAATEKCRDAIDAAVQQQSAELQKLLDNPKAMGVTWSGILCFYSVSKRTALDEIATEKRYSKAGGVQNLAKLYDLQKQLRWSDEGIQRARGALRELQVKPSSCEKDEMKFFVVCINAGQAYNSDAPDCASAESRVLMQMVTAADPELMPRE